MDKRIQGQDKRPGIRRELRGVPGCILPPGPRLHQLVLDRLHASPIHSFQVDPLPLGGVGNHEVPNHVGVVTQRRPKCDVTVRVSSVQVLDATSVIDSLT